jgi:hypothetical protein
MLLVHVIRSCYQNWLLEHVIKMDCSEHVIRTGCQSRSLEHVWSRLLEWIIRACNRRKLLEHDIRIRQPT